MQCPYCRKNFPKKAQAREHVQKYHGDELERDGMNADQALYFYVHGTLHGKCMCGCGKDTDWNYKTGKPFKVSNDPECKRRLKTIRDANMMRVRGTTNMLTDMEFQRQMQHGRKISGTYTFADGGKVEYMARLELSFLKFLDKVMDFKSSMVIDPPESFEYFDPKDSKKHWYMPDFYLPDYNLLVEIKDGGDQTNTNPEFLKTTRYKVALKDEVMKKQTKYNYIRISGTNYGPFVEMLYQIVHEQEPDGQKRKAMVVITEAACLDDDEQLGTADINPYAVNPDTVTLLAGYIAGTETLSWIGITDSAYCMSGYVYDLVSDSTSCISNLKSLAEGGKTVLYRYVTQNNPDRIASMKNAVRDIIVKTERGEKFNLLDILTVYNIFIDIPGYTNNPHRKMDFIPLPPGGDPINEH